MGKINILLDNIRSGQNIGSIFRSADVFRVNHIYICGISATPPNKEILKTALGATETVSWKYFENTIDCIDFLKEQRFELLAIEQSKNSKLLNDLKYDENKNYALIFGNEVEGVSSEILEKCDGIIEIPQFGNKHSLNVSVAAGIVLWDCISKTVNPSELSNRY